MTNKKSLYASSKSVQLPLSLSWSLNVQLQNYDSTHRNSKKYISSQTTPQNSKIYTQTIKSTKKTQSIKKIDTHSILSFSLLKKLHIRERVSSIANIVSVYPQIGFGF